MSEIISGKGTISTKTAQKLSQKLNLNTKEATTFVALANLVNSSSKKTKMAANSVLESLKVHPGNLLSSKNFSLISDWHHFAILSTMELDEFNGHSSWIAQKLNLDKSLVLDSLSLLANQGLVNLISGLYSLNNDDGNLTTTDISSLALRKSHKQTLHQAIDAIDDIEIDLRDISSMTMSIELKKIPKAKEAIRNFRRELSHFLESGKKEEVYNLNIQLVPVTKNHQNGRIQ